MLKYLSLSRINESFFFIRLHGRGTGQTLGQVVPGFASLSASSFPGIPMCPFIHDNSREAPFDDSEFRISCVSMHSLLVDDSDDRQAITDKQSVKKRMLAWATGSDEMNLAASLTANSSA